MTYRFDWSVLWGEWGLLLLDGLFVTLRLAARVMLFAFLLGFLIGIVR